MKDSLERIEPAFLAALRAELEKRGRGAQARLAKMAGIKPAYLNHLVKGRKYGSEGTRRAIAKALGFPYEEFLNVGRSLLEPPEPNQKPSLPFSKELDSLPKGSEERYVFLYRKACEEMEFPDALPLIEWAVKTAGDELRAYQDGEIDDHNLFQEARKRLNRVKQSVLDEFSPQGQK